MNNLILAIITIVLITFATLSVVYGIQRAEEAECEKLHYQEATIEGFYWTDWQVIMCEQYE